MPKYLTKKQRKVIRHQVKEIESRRFPQPGNGSIMFDKAGPVPQLFPVQQSEPWPKPAPKYDETDPDFIVGMAEVEAFLKGDTL